MTDLLRVREVASLEGLSPQQVRKRVNYVKYRTVREERCPGGKRYLIEPLSLSPKARIRYLTRKGLVDLDSDDIDGMDEASSDRVLRLWNVINDLIRSPYGSKESRIDSICREFHLSRNTLRRMIRDYEETGSLTAFLRKKRSDSGKLRCFREEALAVLMEQYCLTLSKKDAYEKMKTECAINMWRHGSYGSACRCLRERIDKSKAMAIYLEKGRKGLEDEVAPSFLRDFSDLECNEIICGDHHQLDIFIYGGKRVYRPWITAWQDLRTRAIQGYALTEIPNSRSIAQALRDVIKQKNNSRHYGVPQKAYIDNGRDYRSYYISGGRWHKKSVRLDYDVMSKTVMAQLGIEPIYSLPYNPRSKPIERWFNTLENRFVKDLPGYCGNSPENRPVHKLMRQLKNQELLTLDEFREQLDHWMEKYHGTAHKGRDMKGRSPNQVWDEAVESKWKPVTIKDEAILRHLFMMSKTRTVRRHGVQIHNEYYYHESLFFHLREKVGIRWDPANLSEVHVFKDNRYLCTAYLYERLSMKTPHRVLSERMQQRRDLIKSIENQYKGLTAGNTKVNNTGGPGNLSRALKKYGEAAIGEKHQKRAESLQPIPKRPRKLKILPPDDWFGKDREEETEPLVLPERLDSFERGE